MKIDIYKNGERYFTDGTIALGIQGGEIVREINLSQATDEEIQQLRLDPYDDALIEIILNRG